MVVWEYDPPPQSSVSLCPSVLIKVSRFEQSLVTEDKIATLSLDSGHFVVQLDCLVVVTVQSVVSGAGSNDYLLLGDASLLHHSRYCGRPDSPLRKLAMEIDGSGLQTERSPSHQVLEAGQILKLLQGDIALGDQMALNGIYCLLLLFLRGVMTLRYLDFGFSGLEVLSIHSLESVHTNLD